MEHVAGRTQVRFRCTGIKKAIIEGTAVRPKQGLQTAHTREELVFDESGTRPQEKRETVEALYLGNSEFQQKFGRDPRPNDPIFFDPDSDEPSPLPPDTLNKIWEQLADAMVCQGVISPEAGYAMKETGMLVREKTKKFMNEDQRREWNRAIEEYRRVGQKATCKPMTDITTAH